ncbi:hypothetical protein ACS0TY_022723 [Phlomoides rotata]
MDKSIVVVEETQWRSDVVKPLGSLVRIKSIAIDIGCAMEEIGSPMHEHFSIRAFVAGMRKKDSKMCLSSASEGGGGDGGDDGDLPPLSIPKFQWWKCSTCVPKTSAKWSGDSKSSCPHDDGELTIGNEFPALTEIGSSARHRYSIAKEGKRKMGLCDPQPVQEVPNNVEHGGTSDDIPMEIVELLAMNQRERALGNSRNHFRSVGTSSPAYVEGRPGTINFSFANARRTGASQGMSNFPQTNRDESQFSLFGSFKPSQQKKTSSLVLEARPVEGADLLYMAFEAK